MLQMLLKEENSTPGEAIFTIALEDVRIFSRHGVFAHENLTGAEFSVNLTVSYLSIDFNPWKQTESFTSDDICNTVSYVSLYEIVKSEMKETRKLLETVAQGIVSRIILEFPEVKTINCKITKISPPIPSFQGSASVSLCWTSEV